MNTPNKILSLLLTLVVAFSLVVLSGHSYSHKNAEFTSCHLCIEHGNSGHAIISSDSTAGFFHSHTPFQAELKIASADLSAYYRLPVRAPPSSFI